jgi:hypothetical protein
MSQRDLIHSYVTLHNYGIDSGDFDPLLALFHIQAELRFEGVAYPPLRGWQAIAKAFQTDPPDDKLELLNVTENAIRATATFRWRSEPDRVGGTLHLESEGALIKRLVIRVLRQTHLE